jgi:predicted RNA-binding protein with PIN domain
VIFTKEAETADLYIEKAARELSKNYGVTVATSDAVEQVIIMGAGAVRMSASGLLEEVESTRRQIREQYLERTDSAAVVRGPLSPAISREQAQELKRQLRGEEEAEQEE